MMTPIILCGGAGTRLWPVSRESMPKQFAQLMPDGSLFKTTLERFNRAGFRPPVLISNRALEGLLRDQLTNQKVNNARLLIEPSAKNTAPAVLASLLDVASRGPHEVVVISPSDHYIAHEPAFHKALQKAYLSAQAGQIVTLGIKPTRPETGYGYLELSFETDGYAHKLKSFTEKPSLNVAREMLARGTHLWNSGIFIGRVDTLIAAFQLICPDMFCSVERSYLEASSRAGTLLLAAPVWAELDAVSIDHAIMEKAQNLTVVPLDAGWSDLGGWASVWETQAHDKDGNVFDGNALAVKCTGTLLRSENPDQIVVGIGLEDVVAVTTPDAVLIAPRSRAHEIGPVVSSLKAMGAEQAIRHAAIEYRWGRSKVLSSGADFQLCMVHLKGYAGYPKQNANKTMRWTVLEGSVTVQIKGNSRCLGPNQSIFVPRGCEYEVVNHSDKPAKLIKLSTSTEVHHNVVSIDDNVTYSTISPSPFSGLNVV